MTLGGNTRGRPGRLPARRGLRDLRDFREIGRPLLWALLVLDLFLLARGALAWALHSHARVVEPTAILWLEPMFLRSAVQVMQNLPLYGPPTTAYVSAMYTPLVDLANGAVLAVFGVGYPPLRALSLGLFLVLLALFARWIQRETRSTGWALVCVGLLLSVSGHVRHWFSSVNVDAPYLLAGLAGAYVLRFRGGSRRAVAAAGGLFAVSFLCKPQGFVLAAAGFAFVLLHERRHAWVFAAVCASLAGGVSLAYLLASDGWYWTSMVTVPFAYPSKPDPRFARSLLSLSRLGTLSLLAGLPLLAAVAVRGARRREASLLLLLAAAALAIAWPSFRKAGGDVNSLYPVALVGLLCFGAAPDLIARGTRAALPLRLAQLAVAALVLGNGFGRDLHALRLLREAPSFAAGRERLFSATRSFEERLVAVVAPAERPFLGARPRIQFALGKPLNTHQTPLFNLTVRSRLLGVRDVFHDRFERGAYDAVVLWDYPADPLYEEVRRHYVRVRELGADPLLRQFRVALWEPRGRHAAER